MCRVGPPHTRLRQRVESPLRRSSLAGGVGRVRAIPRILRRGGDPEVYRPDLGVRTTGGRHAHVTRKRVVSKSPRLAGRTGCCAVKMTGARTLRPGPETSRLAQIRTPGCSALGGPPLRAGHFALGVPSFGPQVTVQETDCRALGCAASRDRARRQWVTIADQITKQI